MECDRLWAHPIARFHMPKRPSFICCPSRSSLRKPATAFYLPRAAFLFLFGCSILVYMSASSATPRSNGVLRDASRNPKLITHLISCAVQPKSTSRTPTQAHTAIISTIENWPDLDFPSNNPALRRSHTATAYSAATQRARAPLRLMFQRGLAGLEIVQSQQRFPQSLAQRLRARRHANLPSWTTPVEPVATQLASFCTRCRSQSPNSVRRLMRRPNLRPGTARSRNTNNNSKDQRKQQDNFTETTGLDYTAGVLSASPDAHLSSDSLFHALGSDATSNQFAEVSFLASVSHSEIATIFWNNDVIRYPPTFPDGGSSTQSSPRRLVSMSGLEKAKYQKAGSVMAVRGAKQFTGWRSVTGENTLEKFWKRQEQEAFNSAMDEAAAAREAEEKRLQSLKETSLWQQVQLDSRQDFLASQFGNLMTAEQQNTLRSQIPRPDALPIFDPELEANSGLDVSTMPSSLRGAARGAAQGMRPANSSGKTGEQLEGQGQFIRYTRISDRILPSLDNFIVYNRWAVNYGRNDISKTTQVSVGNSRAAVGVALTPIGSGLTSTNVNYGINAISVRTLESTQDVKVGVVRGKYAFDIERSNGLQQSSVELISRYTEVAALADQLRNIYGVRTRVRNFEINYQRDFTPQSGSLNQGIENILAQEFAINYRSFSVIVGTDVIDKEYAVSAGVRGYQFSAIRDFDARLSDFQANFGKGWQVVVQGDYPDSTSEEVFTGIGFGRIGRAYVASGMGVGDDGIPAGQVELETADVGLAVDFLDEGADRRFNYALTVGKFSYIWESSIVIPNVNLPVFFLIPPAS
eukprot:GHVT01090856.1.p1 GENE.GHVT01090856.1~~GHVT01090856.1.p1  ORF type:complete len:807 (+),score=54.84 GHVT01090856.1:1320-3740(+)